jgi:Ser/Thr protein kinase RdoA (MazF antagonist)
VTYSGGLEALALPDENAWSSIGLALGPEVYAGHQSRIFHSTMDGDPIVVKLSDSRLVDASFHRRIDVAASLAEVNSSVVGPLPIGSNLVTVLDQWLVVAYPTMVGEPPDPTKESDVARLASTLALLHESMAQLGSVDLPLVAALRDRAADTLDWSGQPQLIHGDYSDANTLFAGDEVKVFDFDDCGYGPVEFEIGNTLYMMLFDAWTSTDMRRYERFRNWFVDAYRSASGRPADDQAIDSAIAIRVEALSRWLEQPELAPIGIRTATPEWRDSLRAFVTSRSPH